MTDFTNIRTAIDNLLTVLDNAAADLVGTANAQKRELFDIYSRMRDTHVDLVEFASIVGDAGAVMLDVEEKYKDIASKVQNVIEIGIDEAPVAEYENFVGFCETCGDEILVGDEYAHNGDEGLVCRHCLNTKAEQLALNLAESTTPADTDNQ